MIYKLTSLVLLLSGFLAAQPAPPTAVYPTRVAGWADLEQTANTTQTTLSAPVGLTDTTINVVSGLAFPVDSEISIDNEIIKLCGSAATTLTVCSGGRGAEGTTASAHVVLTTGGVQVRTTALQHNQTAAEVMALENQLNQQFIFAASEGALCNAIHDDTAAIAAALAKATTMNAVFPPGWTAAATGFRVQLPAGVCEIDATLNIPQGTRLMGVSTLGTYLQTLPGFQGYTPMATLNTLAIPNPSFWTGIEDVTLLCAPNASTVTPGCIGIESTSNEEFTIIHNVAIAGAQSAVILAGFGTQNSLIDGLEVSGWYLASGWQNTSPTCLELTNTVSRAHVTHVTCNGGVPGGNAITPFSAIVLNNFIGAMDHVHCEEWSNCILHNGGQATLNNIDNNQNMVSTVTLGSGYTTYDVLESISAANGEAAVIDQTKGISIPNFVGLYSTLDNGTQVNNLLTTDTATANYIGKLNVGSLAETGGFTMLGADAWSSPDGVTAILNTMANDAGGILLQEQNLPYAGTLPGGGLQLVGGGYSTDPALACIQSGATGPCASYTARAAAATGLTFLDGTMYVWANSGLTAGTGFSNTNKVAFSPAGVQIFASTGAPGTCASAADIGRLWINSSANPNRFEVCMENGAAYAWLYPTMNVGP
jgi:hypothetical protein